jgi:hypothetical protein
VTPEAVAELCKLFGCDEEKLVAVARERLALTDAALEAADNLFVEVDEALSPPWVGEFVDIPRAMIARHKFAVARMRSRREP